MSEVTTVKTDASGEIQTATFVGECRERTLVERLVADDERAYSLTVNEGLALFFIEREGER